MAIKPTSPPLSHLGRERRYPDVGKMGECTLPLRVLAVQCATLRNCYGTLLKRYGNVIRVTECYGAVTGRYVKLQNVIERCGRYGTFRNVTEALVLVYSFSLQIIDRMESKY